MKEEMKVQLIKDIITAVIAWVVAAIICGAVCGLGFFGGVVTGFMLAGIPFGWRFVSNIFTAISIYAVILKFLLALVLGWVALPIVIIKDVVAFVAAKD